MQATGIPKSFVLPVVVDPDKTLSESDKRILNTAAKEQSGWIRSNVFTGQTGRIFINSTELPNGEESTLISTVDSDPNGPYNLRVARFLPEQAEGVVIDGNGFDGELLGLTVRFSPVGSTGFAHTAKLEYLEDPGENPPPMKHWYFIFNSLDNTVKLALSTVDSDPNGPYAISWAENTEDLDPLEVRVTPNVTDQGLFVEFHTDGRTLTLGEIADAINAWADANLPVLGGADVVTFEDESHRANINTPGGLNYFRRYGGSLTLGDIVDEVNAWAVTNMPSLTVPLLTFENASDANLEAEIADTNPADSRVSFPAGDTSYADSTIETTEASVKLQTVIDGTTYEVDFTAVEE